jgi:hypothetical protein
MNERIDKLFEQALEEFKAENKYATIIVPDPLKEKFAELIVWNCMLICEDVMKKDNSALGCWSEIKRTFRS